MPEELPPSWYNGWLERGFRPVLDRHYIYQDSEGRDVVRKSKFKLMPNVAESVWSGEKTYAVQHRLLQSVLLGADKWERGIGREGWEKGLLYNRVAIDKAIENGDDIYLCEGEKDVESVVSAWGVPATSHHQGAAGMDKEQAAVLAKARGWIVIFVDRDLSGYRIAWHQTKMLKNAGFDVRNISYHRPGVKGEKKDISDHIDAGLARGETDTLSFLELAAKISKHGELPTGTARRWSYYNGANGADGELGEWVVNRAED